jgi:hypothetical protein
VCVRVCGGGGGGMVSVTTEWKCTERRCIELLTAVLV